MLKEDLPPLRQGLSSSVCVCVEEAQCPSHPLPVADSDKLP